MHENLYTPDFSRFRCYNSNDICHINSLNFSIESRILFLLKVYDDYKIKRITDLIYQLINTLIESLNLNKGNKDKVLKIAAVFSTMKFSYNEIDFYRAIKIYFSNNLEDLDDFNYIIHLLEINPKLLTDSELDELKEKFEDFYGFLTGDLEVSCILDGKSVFEPDPELIRESSKMLADIGDFFDTDTGDAIEQLEHAAKEIEKILQNSENDAEWIFEKTCEEHEEIDSLFEMLRESLT